MRPHAIATCQSSMLLVESGVVLPFVWHGRFVACVKDVGRSEPLAVRQGDVDSRGRMAREWPHAMMLPEEQCDAKHDMRRCGWFTAMMSTASMSAEFK